MVLDFLIKALFVSYGVICLPFLVIWTSPKSNVSMANWLADCRFDLDYWIARWVRTKFSKNQKSCYRVLQVTCHGENDKSTRPRPLIQHHRKLLKMLVLSSKVERLAVIVFKSPSMVMFDCKGQGSPSKSSVHDTTSVSFRQLSVGAG